MRKLFERQPVLSCFYKKNISKRPKLRELFSWHQLYYIYAYFGSGLIMSQISVSLTFKFNSWIFHNFLKNLVWGLQAIKHKKSFFLYSGRTTKREPFEPLSKNPLIFSSKKKRRKKSEPLRCRSTTTKKTDIGKLVKAKKLEVFGGHLLIEDDHSHWEPQYWNIMEETFSLARTLL